jgi:hypothetical protein
MSLCRQSLGQPPTAQDNAIECPILVRPELLCVCNLDFSDIIDNGKNVLYLDRANQPQHVVSDVIFPWTLVLHLILPVSCSYFLHKKSAYFLKDFLSVLASRKPKPRLPFRPNYVFCVRVISPKKVCSCQGGFVGLCHFLHRYFFCLT